MSHDTLTFNGRTYQLGTHGDPVPLPGWIPTLLPSTWRETPERWSQGVSRTYARVYRKTTGLLVLMSAATWGNGKPWLHVSVSRSDGKIPDWQTMSEVKRLFIGDERTALQVMPPKAKHVNIHPGVLHLYHCLDGEVTPDFTGGGETI